MLEGLGNRNAVSSVFYKPSHWGACKCASIREQNATLDSSLGVCGLTRCIFAERRKDFYFISINYYELFFAYLSYLFLIHESLFCEQGIHGRQIVEEAISAAHARAQAVTLTRSMCGRCIFGRNLWICQSIVWVLVTHMISYATWTVSLCRYVFIQYIERGLGCQRIPNRHMSRKGLGLLLK